MFFGLKIVFGVGFALYALKPTIRAAKEVATTALDSATVIIPFIIINRIIRR